MLILMYLTRSKPRKSLEKKTKFLTVNINKSQSNLRDEVTAIGFHNWEENFKQHNFDWQET